MKLRLTHRERLKLSTRAAHERVDATYSQFDLTTRDGYRAFLWAHSSVLPGLEATLTFSDAATLLPDWPTRLRAPALAVDLASMGEADSPDTHAEPIALTPPTALGMLYVLEGSRLGGAVLAKRVAANPDSVCRDATRYLRHGERQGLWASFVATFDASPYVRDHETDVIDGALAAFALFAGATVRPRGTRMSA